MATTIPDVLLAGPVNYHALRVDETGMLSWESLVSTATEEAVLPEDDSIAPQDPVVVLFTTRNVTFSLNASGDLLMGVS